MFNNWVRDIFRPKARRSCTLGLESLDPRIAPDAAPVLTGATASRSVSLGTPAAIDPSLTVTGPNLTTAAVSITNPNAGDLLNFSAQNGITGNYNSGTATLTLTGSATAAAYQAALRSVSIQLNTTGSGMRSVQFSIAPTNEFTINGVPHLYEYVSASGISWTNAKNAAAARNLYGRQGYLATLTSAAESDFASPLASGNRAWIGGSDAAVEGTWRWVTGPDNGLQFWMGNAGGSSVGKFANWNTGEPNDQGNEDYAYVEFNTKWNDADDADTTNGGEAGYLVEYGGLSGETALQLNSTTIVSIATAAPTVTSPGSAITLNAATISISGSTTAGTTVRVYADANSDGVVDVGDTFLASEQMGPGNTIYSLNNVPLTQNAVNNFLVTAQLPNANESVATPVPTVTEDSIAPTVTVTAPAAAVATSRAMFTITGTSEADSLVLIYQDANGNGVVDAGEMTPVAQQQLTGGATDFSSSVLLNANKANNFLVVATDAASNTSAPIAAPTITQDSTPPTLTVAAPTAATVTANMTVTVAGSTEANALVRVYNDANNNGVIDAGETTPVAMQQLAGGATTFSIAVPLTPNAANNFLVTAADLAGNLSPVVDVPTTTQDSIPPTITLISPTSPTGTPNVTITITGTTEANALVRVYKDANNNNVVDPGEASPVQQLQLTGGATAYSIVVSLDPNTSSNFLVVATDSAGNQSAPADVPTITQDTIPPTITLTAPTAATSSSSNPFLINGLTEAGAKVRVYADTNNNNVIDAGETTPVGIQDLAAGMTSFSIPVLLAMNAANNFLVVATDIAGNTSPVTDVPTITQDSIPPNVTVTSPSTPTTTANPTITITGSTEGGALVRVYKDANNNNVIDPGEMSPVRQMQLTSGVATYSIMVTLDTNAANNYLVTATDVAGNESAPADVPTVTHDTIPPDGPIVTTPTTPVATKNAMATVSGTAEANAFVRVYLDANNNNTIDPGEPSVSQQQLTGGATTFSLTVGLNPNAANNFLVTATDAAGNQSIPADVPTITHDSIAPGAPSVTSPATATFTGNTMFPISGQAEANALVKVYRDVNNNGALDPGDNVVAMQQLFAGATTYTVPTTLTANAPNNFLVTATDAAGNESGPADVPTITQDAVAPVTPTIATPNAPMTVNAATITITGTAEANALVRVYRDANNNNTIDPGELVVNLVQLSGGVTTFFVPVPLNQDAANNYLVTATDAAGNESPPVDVPTITEDSTPPGAPGVTFPAAPTAVNADAITIAGAAEANALVRVYRDTNNNNMIDPGELVVATQQLTGGASSYSIAAPLLQNAANNFLVTATDAAGNESGSADVPTVTEDSVAPGMPSVTTPANAVSTRSATATVAGTTEANALVRVYRDANNNNIADPGELLVSQQLTGAATAYTILVSLSANAANNFLVTAVDAAGNESAPADVPTITQDSIPPATPVVTAPGATLTVNASNFTITGTAEANALVKVYRDANNNNTFDAGDTIVATQQLVGGATAYAIAAPLAQDMGNNFLVTATDAAGNQSLPADVPTITEDSTPPVAPAVTAPAAAVTLHATTITVAGTAEPNALVRVYRDVNNNNAVDPGEPAIAQVQLTGGATAYSFNVSLNQDATNTFVVSAADAVGNESMPADVPTVTEDSTAPAGTTVTGPAAAITVNADTFAVTGTTEANSLVRLYRDRNNNGAIDGGDIVLGQQQLAGGATAFSIAVALAQNVPNDFVVTAADAVGNESAPVDVPTITEDSTAPLGPTVTTPAASVTVAAGPFTVRGVTEANALVKVFLDANNDGVPDNPTAPVASMQLADGATKYAIDAPLTANAANNFVVTATDSVGNASAPVDVPTIFADATGPTGPATQSFSLSGTAPIGTVVGTVQASTAAGGPLTYLITDGNDMGVFALDRNTGLLTVADAGALRRSPRRVTLMVRVSDAADPPLSQTFAVTVALIDPALPQGYAAGSEDGGGVAVLYNPDGTRRLTIEAFPGGTGGVRVAAGDVNGDGVPDLIAASGPGVPGVVRVYDGATKALLYQTNPFEDTFTGGLFVEAADLTGDGRAEVVVSPDVGGGPRVVVINVATRQAPISFFGIEDPMFRGGCRVSLADVDADGTPDVLVAAGAGGGPRVAVYDGAALMSGTVAHLFNDFYVFENTLRNGAYIAGGDINGDGYADIIAGGGPGGAPRVFAVSAKDLIETGTQIVLANFFAGDPDARTAARVTTANLDGDTRADLVVGAGSDNGDRIVVYLGKDITPDGTPPTNKAFNTIDSSITFGGGVYVG